MTQIYVKYNPYKLETEIEVNGRPVEKDSGLYKLVKGKRLQEWVGEFPVMLSSELNVNRFEIVFYGLELDWDDFEEAFRQAEDRKIIAHSNLRHIAGKNDEDIKKGVVKIFNDLREGPVEELKNKELLEQFEKIEEAVFPIHVVATMSSGKSTLINALLGKNLMPSQNEACTATITEIVDNDQELFSAVAFNDKGHQLDVSEELTLDLMKEWNANTEVFQILASGNIPFLDSKDNVLALLDTPGPNNSQNEAHQTTTYRAINKDSKSLILYVMNGEGLATTDDAALLDYVSKQMREGGKQIRDRFLFVINKMDAFDPDNEDIEKTICSAKKYLSKYGIEDPQIFPCSAFTALQLRTSLKDIDIKSLTKEGEKKLPSAAKKVLPIVENFIDYPQMHLEKYSTLSPSENAKLAYLLKKAEEEGDLKEQALIHCGIRSIETAIIAYVKKYANTKKVKDLVESFIGVLESKEVLKKAEKKVSENKEIAEKYIEKAKAIKAKIEDGKEAKKYKEKISQLNPMNAIEHEAKSLLLEAEGRLSEALSYQKEYIEDEIVAEKMVTDFIKTRSQVVARLSTELEEVINREIKEVGEKLLKEYEDKLARMDNDVTIGEIEFNTVDLIRGNLDAMCREVEEITLDIEGFAKEKVKNYGEYTREEKIYYEKTGEEEEEIIVGTHQEKVGAETVKVGSHKEKIGTRKVKNPKRVGFLGFFNLGEKWKIDEDVYEDVVDYEERDVYKTVTDYKTIVRDIFEQRTEVIEKFRIEKKKLHAELLVPARISLENGVKGIKKLSIEQVEKLKERFSQSFDELDQVIKLKYDELQKCASDRDKSKEALEESEKILAWIECCKKEINDLLEI